ncbi:hypothetical protein L6452_37871 [Arctium lappa]|uniref:Uncharacterized protein n=1 Tax=Arctium lappa TaxID=4217 RepID=A0ACB8Y5A5_ARCLA|nr:hypothetical protein L6452_37871 [Arctium lappa]
MASHRNGRGLVKVDHTQPGTVANLRASSSFKSRTFNVRRASFGVPTLMITVSLEFSSVPTYSRFRILEVVVGG